MRILASNPDTIGDLVLRQPLYNAIREAGHELMLVVRPLVQPLLANIAPGVRVIVCEADPYAIDPSGATRDLDDVAATAREFDPDLLVVAPFQWTRLEERLAFALPRAGKVVMAGRRFAHAQWGEASPTSIVPSVRVEVDERLPEVFKNERLAAGILGTRVSLPLPLIDARPDQLAAARAVLEGISLEPGEFWAACVGETQWTHVRNWPLQLWGETLAKWGHEHDRNFLFVGHGSEEEASHRVIEAMGDQGHRAKVWSGAEERDLDTLIGLLALSKGYVGRDTGPMHLAAALEKPVLAVFGGGTWPRFLPAAKAGVSLTVRVPCSGCGWDCHLSESVCIKDVPASAVLHAIDDVEAGRLRTNETREISPSGEMLRRIGYEGMRAAQERSLALATERREQDARMDEILRAIEGNSERLRVLEQRGESGVLPQAGLPLNEVTSRNELALKEEVAALHCQLSAALKRVEELQERAEVAEHANEIARAEAQDQRMELDRECDRTATLDALSRQLQRDLDGTYAELERVRRRLRDVLHQRDELLSSRWRRYGQRVGLVMIMPWERELQNGHQP